MSSFKQHVGVITGGNSGIGLASAKRLIDAGARVAIFGRSEDTVARAAECLGDRAIGIQGDVTVRDDLDRLFGQTHDTFGRIDSVFANAGIAEFRSLDEVDPEHVSRVLDTNLRGTILTVQAALPHLNNPASVIVTTSVVNNKGMAGTGVYAASKAGRGSGPWRRREAHRALPTNSWQASAPLGGRSQKSRREEGGSAF